MEPILSVSCLEKGINKVHDIYPFSFSMDNLYKLWNAAQPFPTLFGTEANKDFGKFCEIFVHYDTGGSVRGNGLVWLIDDYTGIFYMTDIVHPDDAMVHFSFFDRRMRGRENLVRAMLKYVFEKYDFRRLSAEIPMFAVPRGYKDRNPHNTEIGVFAFVKACGFTKEGRKRCSAEYKGDWFDAIQYGILREEIL